MWLPGGWWIEINGNRNSYAFRCGVNNLMELESTTKFHSRNEALKIAKNALRIVSCEICCIGWTYFRRHYRMPGSYRSFCGVPVMDSPMNDNSDTQMCKNCNHIVLSIAEADDKDIENYFRYRSVEP